MTFEELMKQLCLRWQIIELFELWEFDFLFERCRELNIKIGFENLKKLLELKRKSEMIFIK